MFLHHIVGAGEARGEDVGAGVEGFTMPSITSIATTRTTSLQVKPKGGAQILPQTRLQPEEAEEVTSPISDINNLRETSQTSKA
jgi:hypothetical protein